MGERIVLSGVPETMLQTVYARARETQTRGALRDDKAVELVNRLDYDFARGSGQGNAQRLTDYYAKSMMTPPMRFFCRKCAKKKFTEKDLAQMRFTEKLKAADRNPYSWNMDLFEYPDGGYEARFTKCGICTMMKKLGLYDLTPAMCRLDYTMSEAGGGSDFVRKFTLASGGPYCDCATKRSSPRIDKSAQTGI